MNETEFRALADEAIAAIESRVEESGADCDLVPGEGGVLKLEFANRSQIIVNRHGPAQEIWVAARSGGFHYRWSGSDWEDTRTGENLFRALERLIESQGGGQVALI